MPGFLTFLPPHPLLWTEAAKLKPEKVDNFGEDIQDLVSPHGAIKYD